MEKIVKPQKTNTASKVKKKKNKRSKAKAFDDLIDFNMEVKEKKLAENQTVRIAIAGNVDSGKSTLV